MFATQNVYRNLSFAARGCFEHFPENKNENVNSHAKGANMSFLGCIEMILNFNHRWCSDKYQYPMHDLSIKIISYLMLSTSGIVVNDVLQNPTFKFFQGRYLSNFNHIFMFNISCM